MTFEVTENDIFKYVFYPDDLSDKLRHYIKINKLVYQDQIDLMTTMKDQLNTPLEKSLLDKIHKRIDEYNRSEIIVLKKVVINHQQNHYILAADSVDREEPLLTETFKDDEEQYLAKVITTNGKNKIYILSKDPKIELEFILKLYPTEDEFRGSSNDQPIVVIPKQKIEEIEIQIKAA